MLAFSSLVLALGTLAAALPSPVVNDAGLALEKRIAVDPIPITPANPACQQFGITTATCSTTGAKTCAAPGYLVTAGNPVGAARCELNCPTGYYPNEGLRKCVSCTFVDPKAATCAPPNIVLSCRTIEQDASAFIPRDWYLAPNNRCVKACPQFFVPVNGVCLPELV